MRGQNFASRATPQCDGGNTSRRAITAPRCRIICASTCHSVSRSRRSAVAYVGERGQGHDGRDFQRSARWPFPVWTGQRRLSRNNTAPKGSPRCAKRWPNSFARVFFERSGPRVQITKATITREHVRYAFLHRAVLAVPLSISPEVDYCAPWSITKSSACRGSEAHYRRKGSNTKRQFRKTFFRHDDPFLDCCPLNK
jgi:hypothetical protein